MLAAGCSNSEQTDRLEATYAIADFEIEGAERTRTEHNGSTLVGGNRGTSQLFAAAEGVEPQEVFDAAVAAAESDGSVLQETTPRGGVVGTRKVSGGEACDVIVVAAPFGGSVSDELFESDCTALGDSAG